MKLSLQFDSDLKKIFKLLNYNARLVGGCVRDYILFNELVDDIDIATTLLPDVVIDLLFSEFSVIPTGLKHGTVTVIGIRKYEITTLRSDDKTDGRHAEISFKTSYEEDAKRRDFTINALYMDYEGNVYDYFNGIGDLKEKRVRFIGDARQRITEDYLRILRFFRFSFRFGTIDFDDLNVCYELKDNLLNLSKERVTQEWFNIIKGVYFFEYFEYFKPIMDTLKFNLPEDINLDEISKFSKLGLTAYFYSNDMFLRLSNNQKKYINLFLTFVINNEVDGIVAYNKYGVEFFQDSLIYNHKKFEPFKVQPCPVNGQDILLLGYEGKQVGEILKKIEYTWYSKKGLISKENLLQEVKNVL